MSSRNQTKVRRNIGRLRSVAEKAQDTHAAFRVILKKVAPADEKVTEMWRLYQQASVSGVTERKERDEAVEQVKRWVQAWRPAMMMMVPSAAERIRELPAGGGTDDDLLAVAGDMASFLQEHAEVDEDLRTEALAELGEKITVARKEYAEAAAALPAERNARAAYSAAIAEASALLSHGVKMVRSVFGASSPEYRQFVERKSAKEDDDANKDNAQNKNKPEDKAVNKSIKAKKE